MAGFFSGYLEGQQASQQHQLASLALEEGQQKVTMNSQTIEMTRRTLEQQKKMMAVYADKMAKLNKGGQQPTDQAEILAQMVDTSAEANFAAGLTEQGADDAAKASTLRRNAAYVKDVQAKEVMKRAQFGSNLADWVLDAPNDAEAAQRWKQSQMLYMNEFGAKSPYADRAYSRQLVEGLKQMTQTAATKALETQRQAQLTNMASEEKLRAAETLRAQAEARNADARTAKVKKEGGASKADEQQQNRLTDAISDVDYLQTQMEQNPDMTFTGLKGRAHEIGEAVSGFFGGTGPNPEHQFQTTAAALRMKIQRAMAGTSRSSADERKIANTIADMNQPGLSRDIAIDKLKTLKDLLTAQKEHRGVQEGAIERPSAPKKGDVQDGYRFKGGDPADQSNWVKQ